MEAHVLLVVISLQYVRVLDSDPSPQLIFLLKVTATGPAPLTAQIVDKGDGTYNGYYTVPNVTGTWDFTFWYRSVFKVGGGPYTITSVGMFVASATSV